MTKTNCSCSFSCTVLGIIAGAILGAVAALLRITGVITVTPAFLWVVFGIAVVYLGILLIAPCGRYSPCACDILPTVLTGILGTVLTAVILLAVEFVTTSIVGAIITGALILLFTLVITGSACLVRCLYRCND